MNQYDFVLDTDTMKIYRNPQIKDARDSIKEIEEIKNSAAGGVVSTDFDYNNITDSEPYQLIEMYRQLAESAYVEPVIEDIVDEAVTIDNSKVSPVNVDLDDTEFSDNVKDKIQEAFDRVMTIYSPKENISRDFRQFYVDGQINYYIIPNEQKTGIEEIRLIDSRLIRPLIKKTIDRDTKQVTYRKVFRYDPSKVYSSVDLQEYYMQSHFGVSGRKFIDLSEDAVAHANSGIISKDGNILSHLHRAIKPHNMLEQAEDSVLIYRMTRAIDRRVYYVDVGRLTGKRAEAYVKALMEKHRTKMVFNQKTGRLERSKHYLTMQEDIWLPRQEGSRGTEVSNLAGGDAISSLEDVKMWRDKLYTALKAPKSRYNADMGASYVFGRASEISRDEVKFTKFINRQTAEFAKIFAHFLMVECILSRVVSKAEWDANKHRIKFVFDKDSHFYELKESEIIQNRFAQLADISEYIGRYVSNDWVMKNVLRMSEEEIEREQEQIKKEKQEKTFDNPDGEEQF